MVNLKPVFCAAPWAEGVLGSNGMFRPCAKLPDILKLDWREIGLEKAFNSEAMRRFRQKIIAGVPPHPICQTCINTGMTRQPEISLSKGCSVALFEIKRINKTLDVTKLNTIYRILKYRLLSEESRKHISEYRSLCYSLAKDYPEISAYLGKLLKIVLICESYLKQELTVTVIASLRQVSLKAKCNAKCILCPGKYSGWIFSDAELDEKYYDEAFSHGDDITDFFMNGAEYLFVKNWQEITNRLKKVNAKPSISTNGILLTKRTIKYLIDNESMNKLTISLDGGTKETIESIRVGVNFDILMKNLDFLFRYVYEKKYSFTLDFAFVMMKRNYTELPEMIRLFSEMRSKVSSEKIYPILGFGCSSLDPDNVPGYNEFAAEEHMDSIDPERLREIFDKCKEYSETYGVSVGLFKEYSINSYIEAGYPIPKRAEHHIRG